MKMDLLLRVLRWLNILFGGALILIGIGAFLFSRAVVPLLLALGLIVVGPLKDRLMNRLRLPGVDPVQTQKLVDQGASLIFVLLLLAALFLSL
jgi:hypothetical protein